MIYALVCYCPSLPRSVVDYVMLGVFTPQKLANTPNKDVSPHQELDVRCSSPPPLICTGVKTRSRCLKLR